MGPTLEAALKLLVTEALREFLRHRYHLALSVDQKVVEPMLDPKQELNRESRKQRRELEGS